MDIKISILLLSLLLLAVACDPSYKTEMPNLNEENYNTLSLEEQFAVFEKVSGYIDTPDYVNIGIAKKGEKAVPLILKFIENSDVSAKKIDAIYLLSEIHKNYFDLKRTKAEEFLNQKIKNEESSLKKDKYILESYKDVLKKIQAERPEELTPVILSPGNERIPAFYSDDKDLIKYVELIKEKIMQETGMNSEELDDRFSIVGYTKGEQLVGAYPIYPKDNKTLAISFVAKIDWVEFRDLLEFNFLDNKDNKLSLEEIKQQIKVPFYFSIKELKPKSEIEKIVVKANSKLEIMLPPIEAPSYNRNNNIRIDFLNKEILLDVYGKKDEKKNQCLFGQVNLLTGDIVVREIACIVY
ncbi:hypothetical protein HZA97_08150 [Candidatus Woesearchaeota archaeon]|nr:hypothetical protein [Candidatus Woesearchaeota archaeon]